MAITNPAEVWEADPRHIAEDDPADAAVAATRSERAALHAVQEQVRRAVWAVAGLRDAHAAAWHVEAVTKAKPPGAGGGAAGDGFEVGWAGLARLVQARAALVAAAQAAAQARLAGLCTHAISPKVGAGYYSRLPLGLAEGAVGAFFCVW